MPAVTACRRIHPLVPDVRSLPDLLSALEISAAKAIIVAAHGIQSHSGWYYFSSSVLAEHGYDVYSLIAEVPG